LSGTICDVTVLDVTPLPASLSHWPGYLASFIAEHATERFERALADQRVRSKHATVLAVIDAEGPMSQRALCRRLRIDKSPMVGLVDDLEQLGLAERRRSDTDRRIQAIHLTDKGRDAVAYVMEVAALENDRTFGVLDDEQRAQLHDLLLQVAEATVDLR
jgi:DNA-binding MarR family transcriptional regulator